MSRPTFVVLAGSTSAARDVVETLEHVGATVLRVEDPARLQATVLLTRAEVVLYDPALALGGASQFLAGAAAARADLPLLVRLLAESDAIPAQGRSLSAPVLHVEARQLLMEAAGLRRGCEP